MHEIFRGKIIKKLFPCCSRSIWISVTVFFLFIVAKSIFPYKLSEKSRMLNSSDLPTPEKCVYIWKKKPQARPASIKMCIFLGQSLTASSVRSFACIFAYSVVRIPPEQRNNKKATMKKKGIVRKEHRARAHIKIYDGEQHTHTRNLS